MDKVQYLGPAEITTTIAIDEKTPKGNPMVTVVFKDKPSETYPLKIFEALVSDEPHDFNWIRENRYKALLDELAGVCLEADLKFEDLAYIGKTLVYRLENSFERASNFLWTKDDKKWVAGVPFLFERSLIEAEKILKTINGEKNN